MCVCMYLYGGHTCVYEKVNVCVCVFVCCVFVV